MDLNHEIPTFALNDVRDLANLAPPDPSIAYARSNSTYYLRNRGVFRGQVTQDGDLRAAESPSWQAIDFTKYMYTVLNKAELDKLTVLPPAICYRLDNSRYYVRIGPEGYGGHTGSTQKRDANGDLMWDNSGTKIRRVVNIAGNNRWNTLYVNLSQSEFDALPVGATFAALGQNFRISSKFKDSNQTYLVYQPEFDLTSITSITTNLGLNIPVLPRPNPTNTISNTCVVQGNIGTVLIDMQFTTNDPNFNGTYTIQQIVATNTYIYTPETSRPFEHGTVLTMLGNGNPIIDPREPNVWICISHLYDDNEGYL